MTKKHDYIIAWMEVRGKRFEVLARPEYVFRYREGEELDMDDVLWIDIVYRDSRKGLKASPEELKKAFGTTDVKSIARRIIREGEIQLTEEQRRKLLEAKRRQVINYIARNAIDPSTNKPIPATRIESAMEQLRIGIDLYKDPESQAVEIVRKLARVMRIRLAKALIEARIPPQYSGRVYGELQRMGELKKTEWLSDGSLKVELEIPAGAQIEVVNRIQNMTRGQAQINVKGVF
ncbi:MAG: ribosome assembly factor SBDS [Desulfurococcales archaeon]|nr:ribosome assembly factor SBDS [Desulfurococcales archaeon]MEB3779898.1 ribosome assembly factor SBDS [Desulfurococcales archaeon]